MTIVTKYSIEDMIWFLYGGDLYCSEIIGVETSYTKEETKTLYITTIKNPTGQDVPIVCTEPRCFSSKEELLSSLTQIFYQSQIQGSS